MMQCLLSLCGYVGLILAGAALVCWHIRQERREAWEGRVHKAEAVDEGLEPLRLPPRPSTIHVVPLPRTPVPNRLLNDHKHHPANAAKLAYIASGRWTPEGLGWADETRE